MCTVPFSVPLCPDCVPFECPGGGVAFLSITTNFPDVERSLRLLEEDIRRKAAASALNKTVDQARVQMQRQIASEFNVSVAYVRERLRVRKAFAAGQLTLSAELIGGDKRKRSANVIAFIENRVTLAEARRRAKGGTLRVLRVKVKRGQVRKLEGAFIANKGRTVFKRDGDKRLPISPVQTIDVGQMFNTKRINAAVLRYVDANLPRIFEREAAFFAGRFNRAR
jgi:Prophage minor tail protein Z (GPZ)